MRRRFFVDGFDENSASLRGDAADHLGRVLRAEPGQLYELSDGERVWLGRINRVALAKSGKSEIGFELVEPIPTREPKLQTHLLLSIVKFDRFEWSLEKATELGVAEITPLAAARTDKPLVASAARRRERWQKILLESAQQSRRLRPPLLHEPICSADAFAHCGATVKILLSERADAPPMAQTLAGARPMDSALADAVDHSATLAIGPEGGWTDEEITAARAAKFGEASLGETILRTETAALAALAILRYALNPSA